MKYRRQRQFKSNSHVVVISVLVIFVVCLLAVTSQIVKPRIIAPKSGIASSAVPPAIKSPTEEPSPTSSSIIISPSLVDAIKMPSQTPSMNIDASVQPIIQQNPSIPRGDCEKIIQPTEVGQAKLGVYQCTNQPFTSPSTNQNSTVVLAGHQSVDHYWNTVFDHLSCTSSGCGPYSQSEGCNIQKAALKNRPVYLHTQQSGSYWFEYTITDVFCPSKNATQDLSLKEQLWHPTAGRLLLVTCLEQQGLNYGASNNLIVEANYTRITQNPS